MLFFQKLRDFVDHLKPMHRLLVVLNALVVFHTSLVHSFHEVDCDGFGVLVEVFLSFDRHFLLVACELVVTFKLRQEHVALPLGLSKLERRVVLNFHDFVDLHFVDVD